MTAWELILRLDDEDEEFAEAYARGLAKQQGTAVVLVRLTPGTPEREVFSTYGPQDGR